MLQHAGKFPFDARWLAEQLGVYPKARYKIPSFTRHYCLFTAKSYEQASGESSAFYKSKLFKGKHLLDLTGGLGVDDWAFSKSFESVLSLDPDASLNRIARHNFRLLAANNISRIDARAEDFIKGAGHFDLVYLDADRRAGAGRSIKPAAGSPDFFEIKERLFELSDRILIKCSPLLDIEYCIRNFEHIHHIYVVSVDAEVKELLCLLDKSKKERPLISAVCLKSGSETVREFTGTHPLTKTGMRDAANAQFFFESDAAIIKAGLSAAYAYELGLSILAPHSNYLLGNHVPAAFMGRAFRVIDSFEFNQNRLRKYLTDHKIESANVAARNFPLRPEEISKKFRFKDGGETYLFFSENQEKIKYVFICEKLRNVEAEAEALKER
jgi:ubiquinone/menaquinone biosynthesis C-methylase UbiE